MSKPIKTLLRNDLIEKLNGVESLAIVGFTGLDAADTATVRATLAEKEIKLTVVKNAMAKQAFKEIGLENVGDLLDGPCAVAHGSDSVVSVVRELLDLHKQANALVVKGAVLDGELFGEDRVKELSLFPTRDEAISQVVQCVLSSGANLAGCLVGPGGQIASILKTIEEKQEEAA